MRVLRCSVALALKPLSHGKPRAGRFHFVGGGFDHELVTLDFVNADPAIFAGALYQLCDLFHHIVPLPASDDGRANFLKRPAFAIVSERLLPASLRLRFS